MAQTITVGSTKTGTVTGKDANGNTASYHNLSAVSSNPSIVSVAIVAGQVVATANSAGIATIFVGALNANNGNISAPAEDFTAQGGGVAVTLEVVWA